MDLEEKSKLAEGLALIALVDRRRDFLEAGFSSMHAYCTGQLHMSDEQASRRISVARLGVRVPLVFPFIADGRLTVTNACELAGVLTPEDAPELLMAATFKSKLEVRRIVHERSRPAPRPARQPNRLMYLRRRKWIGRRSAPTRLSPSPRNRSNHLRQRKWIGRSAAAGSRHSSTAASRCGSR